MSYCFNYSTLKLCWLKDSSFSYFKVVTLNKGIFQLSSVAKNLKLDGHPSTHNIIQGPMKGAVIFTKRHVFGGERTGSYKMKKVSLRSYYVSLQCIICFLAEAFSSRALQRSLCYMFAGKHATMLEEFAQASCHWFELQISLLLAYLKSMFINYLFSSECPTRAVSVLLINKFAMTYISFMIVYWLGKTIHYVCVSVLKFYKLWCVFNFYLCSNNTDFCWRNQDLSGWWPAPCNSGSYSRLKLILAV